jgi:hypothetical protein
MRCSVKDKIKKERDRFAEKKKVRTHFQILWQLNLLSTVQKNCKKTF